MAGMAHGHVLVLDGDKIPALDIVRGLGRAGVSVTAGAPCKDAVAFRSRFARACVTYPDPADAPAAFIEWLEETLRRDRCSLVIPVTDLTVVPISKNLDRLGTLSALATESFDKMQIVCDKASTLQLARTVGVPAPASVVVRSADDLERRAETLQFPIACKPLSSSVWAPSGFRSFPVFYAFDRRELRAEVLARIDVCPVILQEYTQGIGVGVEVLARNGELLQVFQHRRLHELPLTGGGSTYRMSVPVDRTLRDYAARLMGALRWTGVAMIEFKVNDETGAASLMEINGRFWGSLPLSSRAGMCFAKDLYEMLVREKTPAPRPYRSGVRCRRLRDDIEWFKANLSVDPRDPAVLAGFVRPRSIGTLLREAVRMASPAEHYDVQVFWDPAPGAVDLWQTAVEQLRGVKRRIARGAGRLSSRWYRLRRRNVLVQKLPAAEKLLFVCYGNIIRSPFASAYLARRTSGNGSRIETTSAGIYDRQDREADPRAIAAGRGWNIDLSSHRSKPLSDDLIRWADLIFVMDRTNLEEVRKRYPDSAGKLYLLGAIASSDSADVQIPDPYRKDAAAVEAAYRRIVDAIDSVLTHARC